MGVGVKYMIAPNVVADMALKPDFSQVEADAAQIDVNETFRDLNLTATHRTYFFKFQYLFTL